MYIEVGDVNDHRPLSEWAVYWPAVLENTAPNTMLLTVQAQDPDPGIGLHYAITAGNQQSLFKIDHSTGTVHGLVSLVSIMSLVIQTSISQRMMEN